MVLQAKDCNRQTLQRTRFLVSTKLCPRMGASGAMASPEPETVQRAQPPMLRTIPIRTVKARINRHLKSLYKKFAIIIIQRIVNS